MNLPLLRQGAACFERTATTALFDWFIGAIQTDTSLLVDHDRVHDPICDARLFRKRFNGGAGFQVPSGPLSRSVVQHVPLAQQQQMIQKLEDICAGLMDDDGDGMAHGTRQLLQGDHQIPSSRRIQSGCWLIQQKQGRACHQLCGHGGPLAFTTADARHIGQCGPDEIVSNMQQSQLAHRFFHQRLCECLVVFNIAAIASLR
mmetsp:Transcript_19023/g.54032  ORF Transcript_19023/g.54032 Transcript_19023/m.54032 type:complete len:202 (+) Transcript_19023:129-734(+)